MKPPKKISHHQEAFTLIELLTVVAIVGLLFALLFPSFGTMIEKGKQETCASNLRHLARAEIMYSQENNGLVLRVTDNNQAWPEILAPYVEKVTKYDNSRVSGVFACPKGSVKSGGGNYSDYGKNYYANGQPQDTWGSPHHQSLTSVGMPQPSKVILFGDSASQSLDPGVNPATFANGYTTCYRLIFRHGANRQGLNGRANVAYFDGHVEALKVADFPSTGSFWMNYPWNPTP